MYNLIHLNSLNEYFSNQYKRAEKGVFFYRVASFSDNVYEFVVKMFNETRVNGVCIEGGLQNPTENNLKYYDEVIGIDFKLDSDFINGNIAKWLPRLQPEQHTVLVESILNCLLDMKNKGKNDNILKNAYIKYMCWLYYKFEQVLSKTGGDVVPKILYEGSVNTHELNILYIVASCGCDVILLETDGDAFYSKIDINNEKSYLYNKDLNTPFPTGFSISNIREKLKEDAKKPPQNTDRVIRGAMERLQSAYIKNTNQWLSGNTFYDVISPSVKRGSKENNYYNAFIKMVGVEDKITYKNEIYQMYQKVQSSGRKSIIFEGDMLPPQTDEINKINRKDASGYASYEDLLGNIIRNISYDKDMELENLFQYEFLDLMLEESKKDGATINRILNKSVAVISLFNRYKDELFGNWSLTNMPIIIFLNSWQSENQSLFIKFMSMLPVDVLMLFPDTNKYIDFKSHLLFQQDFEHTLVVDEFPKGETQMVMGTVAYHAEQELNTMMYDGNTGIYRNQQYQKANSIILQTMYEEISILWKQEAMFRPNFSSTEDVVNLPVIFAKVSGVKDGNRKQYWSDIKKMIVENTYVIKKVPFCYNDEHNPVKQHVNRWWQNSRLNREIILNHKDYKYAHLRADMQQHIFDKIELLINRKTIKGAGTILEHSIICTLLALNRDIVRLLQKFDFTKSIPKIICVDTTESTYSEEDSIILAFLNLIGFDIVLFTPTGYQNIEKYYNVPIIYEHQIGEYIYDMETPRLESNTSGQSKSWKNKLFGRN